MRYLLSILLLIMTTGYLGTFGGKLCIYKEPGVAPVQLLPYSVTVFTQNDQALLKKGIPYHNEAEFSRLMEDYLS